MNFDNSLKVKARFKYKFESSLKQDVLTGQEVATKKVFIYSRKSVWTGKGKSIENQVEMCRQYIANRIDGGKDAEIVIYEDEGFSGKNLDRPQFQKMLADSKRQKPDYIVCYRLDRISRSVGTSHRWWRTSSHGISASSASRSSSTRQPRWVRR